MISVEEARARVLAGLRPVHSETIGLAQGWNRVLATPIIARLTQPPADVSAMDGYALRAADGIAGAKLRIRGTAPAGHPFTGIIGHGEAIRLFTGSFVPEGADSILLQEDANAADGLVTLSVAVPAGKHIRKAGQDFRTDDVLIPAGRQLTARDIGLAAAANHPWIHVYRRPRIAILATGDEISLPGETISAGGIVSSNAHALAALVTSLGGDPVVLPIAKDDLLAIADGADAARGTDLLLTTGGASVGDHDLVRQGLETRGLELDFWKIAMRPGKPLIFGRMGKMPVLGLPGNPVSAFVCAMLFLVPAIRRMSGLPGEALALEPATLGAALKPNDQREDYLRARLAQHGANWIATPFATQDSAMLGDLARADALIRRPPHQEALEVGAPIEVIRLGNL
jgi:molybdopterin molybdotransferase